MNIEIVKSRIVEFNYFGRFYNLYLTISIRDFSVFLLIW